MHPAFYAFLGIGLFFLFIGIISPAGKQDIKGKHFYRVQDRAFAEEPKATSYFVAACLIAIAILIAFGVLF
ncbi:TPA: hypothetical protein GX533_01190 [Candidatus Dojkabacteria bacterium]|jgi:hypothetical protein|uniref:Uncharacterized protein n=1 Tax=Candidatus Dojkabacteria bacterium TaxID=2099670 RepID=A0A832R8W3_9BACT|nr:hypothetical protein [Candidatus Dojkabacteria bacterium]